MSYVVPIIQIAATLIGTGVAVYGSVQASKSAEAMADYNAKVAQQQAKHQREVGDENARRRREINLRYLSTQRAQYAKAGVQMTGTPLAVLGKTASVLEQEALDISYQAELAAQRSFSEARMARFEGAAQSRAYLYQGAGSLLSGVGTAAQQYDTAVQKGALPDTFGIYR